MSRTKEKKRPGGGKASSARNTLRERDRDLSMAHRQNPMPTRRPYSTRLSRMTISQCLDTNQSSESNSQITGATSAQQGRARCVQARSELMSSRLTDILDLRHVDSEELGESCEHFTSHHALRDFRILFSAGFLGFSGRTRNIAKLLKGECFTSLVSLADIFVSVLRPHFEMVTGLGQEMYELAGYDVCFPEGFVCGQVVVDPGQRVLIRSEYMLSAWAHQAYNMWRYKCPRVVIRVTKVGGALFDPTFRTLKELKMPHDSEEPLEWISLPSKLQDTIEPAEPNTMRKGVTKREKSRRKRQKRQRRVQREAQRDTGLIGLQRLMERQHLSDEDDHGARVKSDLQAEARDVPTAARQSMILSETTEQTEMELD